MRKKILPLLSLVSLFGILAMVNFATPLEVGVVGVLVFFTMIFILLFSLMTGIIKIFQRILKDKNKGGGRSENKTYLYATILAFGPIALMIARSVDLFTLALVVVFVSLGCFLVYKRA